MGIKATKKRYDEVWEHASLQEAHIWPTWEIVKSFQGKRCLEIGCGNYPKLPHEGSIFLDLSAVAMSNLRTNGLNACAASAENLPLKQASFDLVVAWEVLEHIESDENALAEIARVLKDGGHFFLSVPLGEDRFSQLDVVVGHKRRYNPQKLATLLARHHLNIVKFRCPYLVKRLENVPGFRSLLNRVYSQPGHRQYFGLPKPLLHVLTKLSSSLIRATSGSWRTGPLQGLEEEVEINVLCQKNAG